MLRCHKEPLCTKEEVEQKAAQCSIGMSVDSGTIKFFPIGVINDILLELKYEDNSLSIVSHKSIDLTRKYKGRSVSPKWLFGFLEHNFGYARQQSMEAQAKDNQQCERVRQSHRKLLNRRQQLDYYIDSTIKSSSTLKSVVICPICDGDGKNGRCYKCEGTGWI